jgi:hypothetical protein
MLPIHRPSVLKRDRCADKGGTQPREDEQKIEKTRLAQALDAIHSVQFMISLLSYLSGCSKPST